MACAGAVYKGISVCDLLLLSVYYFRHEPHLIRQLDCIQQQGRPCTVDVSLYMSIRH